MKNLRLKTFLAASTVLLAATSPWLRAQEEAASPPPVKPRDAEIMPLAPKGLLLDVTSSGKHLFAVGDRGVILVSNNSKDWAQVPVPVRSALTGISFSSEQVGYAVGHDAVILKTADGGKTWALQNFEPELEKPFLSVLALDDDHVIGVGAYGLLYRTSDGGNTWAQSEEAVELLEGELHLNKIAKLANGNLLIVGEQGTMGLSTDGGETWQKLESPYDGSLFGAQQHGPNGAIVYGLRGNVFKCDDVAAAEWTQVDVDTVSSFFGGATLPDGSIALVGLAGKAIKLDASDAVTRVKVTQPQTDANGNTQEKDVTGSFSAALAWGGRLVVVGELGVQSAAIN
jgi:photosystem II stability/assembly factor-like uncharacterized protein